MIAGHVQLNVNGPKADGNYNVRRLDAPVLGLVTVDENGDMKFPEEIWLRINGPGLPDEGTMVCTDENGCLSLETLGFQATRLYVIKYDKPEAASTSSAEISLVNPSAESTQLKILGPNAAGMHQTQKFDAPFPGLVGEATFNEGGILRFADTNVVVNITVTGPGLNQARSFSVKPSGISLRNIAWVERDNRETYTIEVHKPKS